MEHMKIMFSSFGVAAPKTAHHTRSDGRSYSIPADRCRPLVICRSCGLVAMTILTVKPWIQRNLLCFLILISIRRRETSELQDLVMFFHLALDVWNPAPCRKLCKSSWDHLSISIWTVWPNSHQQYLHHPTRVNVVESRRPENHLLKDVLIWILNSYSFSQNHGSGKWLNIWKVSTIVDTPHFSRKTHDCGRKGYILVKFNHIWLHPMSDVVINLTLVSSLAVHFGDGPFFQVRPNPSTLRKIAPGTGRFRGKYHSWRKEMSCSVWCYLSVHGLLYGQIKNESIERNHL